MKRIIITLLSFVVLFSVFVSANPDFVTVMYQEDGTPIKPGDIVSSSQNVQCTTWNFFDGEYVNVGQNFEYDWFLNGQRMEKGKSNNYLFSIPQGYNNVECIPFSASVGMRNPKPGFWAELDGKIYGGDNIDIVPENPTTDNDVACISDANYFQLQRKSFVYDNNGNVLDIIWDNVGTSISKSNTNYGETYRCYAQISGFNERLTKEVTVDSRTSVQAQFDSASYTDTDTATCSIVAGSTSADSNSKYYMEIVAKGKFLGVVPISQTVAVQSQTNSVSVDLSQVNSILVTDYNLECTAETQQYGFPIENGDTAIISNVPVNPTNNAPTLSLAVDATTVNQNSMQTVTYTITYADMDDDVPVEMNVSILDPNGNVVGYMRTLSSGIIASSFNDGDYTNGEIYTVTNNDWSQTGTYSYVISAYDGSETTTITGSIPIVQSQTIQIVSVQTNDPVVAGDIVKMDVVAVDPNNEPITYTIDDSNFVLQPSALSGSFEWDTTINDEGVYYVQITASSITGQASTYVQFRVLDPSTPKVNIYTPTDNDIIGFGYIANFGADITNNMNLSFDGTLTWSSDTDGVLGTGKQIQSATLSKGAHIITATAVDSQGRTNYDRIVLNVADQNVTRDVQIVATPSYGYIPLTINFDVNVIGTAPIAYSWDFDNNGVTDSHGKQTAYTYHYEIPHTYTVVLTAYYSDGYAITRTKQISTEMGDVSPRIQMSNSLEKGVGVSPQEVEFKATIYGNGPFTYAWDFDGDGFTDSTEATPKHTYKKVGTYTVVLTITDIDGDQTTVMDTVKIEEPEDDLFVSRINFIDGEHIQAGDFFRVSVSLENNGNSDIEDARIILSIPELGIRRSSGYFDLNKRSFDTQQVSLEIPVWAQSSPYDLKITVNNDEFRRVKYRPIRVY